MRFVDSKISALGICIDAADAIVALVQSYERLNGLRRTPCFLPYIIFASSIAHLRVEHTCRQVPVRGPSGLLSRR